MTNANAETGFVLYQSKVNPYGLICVGEGASQEQYLTLAGEHFPIKQQVPDGKYCAREVVSDINLLQHLMILKYHLFAL